VLKYRFLVADTAHLQQMVETRGPLVIPDTQIKANWRGNWVQSYASTPIHFRGETIGFLSLDSTTPNFFRLADAERLQAFADQAAIALENARLHQEIRHYAEELEQRVADRTRELAALYEVTAVASESPDVTEILSHSLTSVLHAMRSERGAICLVEETSGVLNLAVHQGFSAEMLATSLAEELAQWVIEQDEPLIVPNTKSDTRTRLLKMSEAYAYAGVPLRARGQPLGVITILRDPDQPAFTAEELALLSSIADQVGVVVESARLRQQAKQAAVMEERRRLARDLHDSVTQLLYSLNLFASVGQEAHRQGDLNRVAQSLAELSETAKQALKEMRLLVYELRPPILEHDGLVGALQHRLDAVEGRAGVTTQLLVKGNPALPAPVEDILYHITQEALNNILKHAAATAVTVKLETNGASLDLEIRDDGKGFDPNREVGRGGLGLISMRERVEQLHGQLTIASAPEQGTTINVSLRNLEEEP
jgi:signal transduction histidine kinase